MSSIIRIIFTGGGSGGHIYPLLAVSEELAKLAVAKNLELEPHYMGPKDEYAKILSEAGFRVQFIPAGKLRRYFSLANFVDIPKFFFGFIAALFKMYFTMPDAIFSKGGTGAFPAVLAGRFYRIPVIIHESDATPGLTNLLSARFATRIAVSFERTLNFFSPKKTAWVGTPLREKLLADIPSKEDALDELGFEAGEPLVLILGGSQGAVRINEFILANLEMFLKETQILHQTGYVNFAEVEKLAKAALASVPIKNGIKNRYKAVPYLDYEEMKTALAAADLVVARAGSGTISETSAFGKPAILIPLKESANDHQRINAYEFAKSGAALVIEEANLLPGLFLNQLRSVIKNPEMLSKMSTASAKFFKPGAAEIIANEILRIVLR
jgi:UDP-N-acetylglucosamine--N-acetylmuramyl-(pentapeptide) pyrophosphoryl-undecaprenol N-acetylglucosamine transferase